MTETPDSMTERPPASGADVDIVSELLRAIRLSGGVFFRAEFSDPFSIESPRCEHIAQLLNLGARRVIPFHMIVEGSCVVRIDGADPQILGPGDVGVFLNEGTHVVASGTAARPTAIGPLLPKPPYDGVPLISYGGGGPATRMICGYLHHERAVFNPLFTALPAMLVTNRATSEGNLTLPTVLQCIEDEVAGGRPGGACLLTRLCELMFIQVLRIYMERMARSGQGWPAGLQDPFVGQALRLLHSDPSRDWSMENLCAEVGRSRSALIQRFTSVVGQPPMRYLASWRMQMAAQILLETNIPVSAVAARVGYCSEVAFNRAFRRKVGAPPGAWRRQSIRTVAACE